MQFQGKLLEVKVKLLPYLGNACFKKSGLEDVFQRDTASILSGFFSYLWRI